jgi:hypothetical protein
MTFWRIIPRASTASGAQEGSDRGGQLRLVPHAAQHPAAHRSQLFDQPAQHRGHLHPVPRQIELVHRKTIRGELWEKKPTFFPPASIATSRTKSATFSTPRAWPMPIACAAMAMSV